MKKITLIVMAFSVLIACSKGGGTNGVTGNGNGNGDGGDTYSVTASTDGTGTLTVHIGDSALIGKFTIKATPSTTITAIDLAMVDSIEKNFVTDVSLEHIVVRFSKDGASPIEVSLKDLPTLNTINDVNVHLSGTYEMEFFATPTTGNGKTFKAFPVLYARAPGGTVSTALSPAPFGQLVHVTN